MGVFQRMKDITRASVHDWLDKVEDPVVMLNQYLRDMEKDIAQAEVSVAKQMATERKLKQRLDEAVRIGMEREAQALTALQQGNEEQARLWLQEKLYYDREAEEIRALHREAKSTVDELVQQLHDMKEQFYQMRNRRQELAARAQLAKTRKQMARMTTANSLETGRAAREFHRMEEKILQMEIETEIIRQAPADMPPHHRADGLLQRKVEEQLQALRQQLGEKNSPKASDEPDVL
mgnify:CR=1 FL=1